MKNQFLRETAATTVAVLLCAAASGAIAITRAQQPAPARGRAQAPPPAGGLANPSVVSPAEIQRMFEAYAAMQAQEQLRLGGDQYVQFLARYKALQDARRRDQQERNRILQDLRRLAVDDARSDDSQIKDRLKALRDLDGRSAADIAKAQDAIDEILDLRQQARFRVFEEQMERRKVDLVTRARGAPANRLRVTPPQ
jgi:hypothetical protein